MPRITRFCAASSLMPIDSPTSRSVRPSRKRSAIAARSFSPSFASASSSVREISSSKRGSLDSLVVGDMEAALCSWLRRRDSRRGRGSGEAGG